jgi:hypothetical protein
MLVVKQTQFCAIVMTSIPEKHEVHEIDKMKKSTRLFHSLSSVRLIRSKRAVAASQ